ncbi:MAG: M23 family metallopeptidase [Chitinophagaceae bacterium]|nr:M23 family metallopeptidase [Chitinophagaceae bacterium]HQV05681.1 M23 family metallopeptidase [Chitinophagaceae bacterium]
MNKNFFRFVFSFACCLPMSLLAQKKDSVWLRCPLDEAVVVPPPKNVMQFDEPDLCIVLVSVPDTTVKAVVTGRVSNVVQNDDGKWDVVYYYRDFYFWYAGLSKVFVKRGNNVKTGDPLGTISKGGKLEFLMYNFETPMDPVRYLDCKKVLIATD